MGSQEGTKISRSAMEKLLFVCVCSVILLVCVARPTNENKRQFETTCTYWRYHLCGHFGPANDNGRRHVTPKMNSLLPRAEEDDRAKRELVDMLNFLRRIVRQQK